jgi:adenylate cyclase
VDTPSEKMRRRGALVKLPPERAVRLTAGLIMFSYAICHLISHATGLFLLDGIQTVGHDVILAPWRTMVGLWILLGAFLTHLFLGLKALYRRRHLRMPAIEAWQLGLGLCIPLLLAPHVTDARLAVLLYGAEDSYFRVLYLFWVTDPLLQLSRQFALLVVVWTHGCIGIHMWLRFRPWYPRWSKGLAVVAIGLPVLAILGITNAGWDTILRAATEPGFSGLHGPPAPTSPHAGVPAAILALYLNLQLVYLALLALTLILRALRSARERRSGRIDVHYQSGRRITVPRGFSILEASRWAGIPHASVCGGRGRCSTCRVRVARGLEQLERPGAAELATLQRIAASAGVRLACQVRPLCDVSVSALVSAAHPLEGLRIDLSEGRELEVTALNVDLRDSMRLAAGRLPFDAIFIVNRYIAAATGAIMAHRGHVTSVAGDGIMSVFGLDGDAVAGARKALAAAAAVWGAIDRLSTELADEIEAPLRFGLGLHSGLSVVGAVGGPERGASLQFLGDTGNVAARLQALTKEMGCTLIVSTATLEAADWRPPAWRRAVVEIRGGDPAMPVFLIERSEELAADLLHPTDR